MRTTPLFKQNSPATRGWQRLIELGNLGLVGGIHPPIALQIGGQLESEVPIVDNMASIAFA